MESPVQVAHVVSDVSLVVHFERLHAEVKAHAVVCVGDLVRLRFVHGRVSEVGGNGVPSADSHQVTKPELGAVVEKSGDELLERLPHDADEADILGQVLADRVLVKDQMVAQDVKVRPVPRRRHHVVVPKLAALGDDVGVPGQHDVEMTLESEAVQDVHDGGAGRLVHLKEEHVPCLPVDVGRLLTVHGRGLHGGDQFPVRHHLLQSTLAHSRCVVLDLHACTTKALSLPDSVQLSVKVIVSLVTKASLLRDIFITVQPAVQVW